MCGIQNGVFAYGTVIYCILIEGESGDGRVWATAGCVRGVDSGRASEGLVAQEPGLCGNWFQIECMEWTVTK